MGMINQRAMNKLFAQVVAPVARPAADRPLTHVFVRDLVLDAMIGADVHERDKPQRVRVNLDLTVELQPGPPTDNLADVVSYDNLITSVRDIVGAGHVGQKVAELAAAGYLSSERVGRRKHYAVHADRPFRHPLERHCSVQALLDALTGPPA